MARYGGEEFIAVMPKVNINGGKTVAQRIQESLALRELEHPDSDVGPHVTLSMGLYVGVPDGESSQIDFLKRADKALYAAKGNGRNRIEIFEV